MQDEAAVAAESAAIASIEQSIILQQDAIDQAGANLDSAEAERTRASLDHARYAVLVGSASATRQRFESATADAQKASASVAAMKATLASARQQNEVLSAQRREAEAKLDRAKAALEGARDRSRQDRGQGAHQWGDSQGQCPARRVCASGRAVQSADDDGVDRPAAIKAPVQTVAAHNPASGRIAFGALDGAQTRTVSRAN